MPSIKIPKGVSGDQHSQVKQLLRNPDFKEQNRKVREFYQLMKPSFAEVKYGDGRVISFDLLSKVAPLISAPIILTSMPADPLHVGHVRLLLESVEVTRGARGVFVVIVNDDEFLKRKKGYAFMPLAERMEVIAAIRGVDYVAPWSSPTQFVDQAILAIRPTYFTKGGDRSSPAQIAQCELDACQQVGCEILYGVGGSEKVQSSSWLVERKNNKDAGSEA